MRDNGEVMNYANSISIYGMLPKAATLIGPLTYYKDKAHTKIVTFDPNFKDNNAEVSYMYMDNPGPTKSSSEIEVTQGPFDKEFFKLEGSKYKHLRNIRNKYNKVFIERGLWDYSGKDEAQLENLMNVWWDKIGDKNYGWNVHLGYDKRYFKESMSRLKGQTINLFFYLGDVLVGYAVFDCGRFDESGMLTYTYMLGKYDPRFKNISRYLDYLSYRYLYNLNRRPFVVNLGTASRGLLKYKLQTFPTYATTKRYFYKIKPHEEA